MEHLCMHCGNIFEGNMEKFCSANCRYAHVATIKKRIKDAMDNDPNQL